MNTNHPLRVWRQSKGLTIEQVAKLIDVNQSSIARYELGHRTPAPEVLARIEAVTLRRVTASHFLPDLPTMSASTFAGHLGPAEAAPPVGVLGGDVAFRAGSSSPARPEREIERSRKVAS